MEAFQDKIMESICHRESFLSLRFFSDINTLQMLYCTTKVGFIESFHLSSTAISFVIKLWGWTTHWRIDKSDNRRTIKAPSPPLPSAIAFILLPNFKNTRVHFEIFSRELLISGESKRTYIISAFTSVLSFKDSFLSSKRRKL